MSGLIGQFVDNFKKGRNAAFVERGFRQGDQPAPDSDAAETQARSDGEGGDNSVVEKLIETVKTLRNSNKDLEAERDEANKLLQEVADEALGHQQRIEALEGELAEANTQTVTKTELIEKLTATVKTLQAQTGELESERETLAAALEIPGMSKVMRKVVHEDTHPNADADQRHKLTAWSQTVNAAFALLKRLKAAPEDDSDG